MRLSAKKAVRYSGHHETIARSETDRGLYRTAISEYLSDKAA